MEQNFNPEMISKREIKESLAETNTAPQLYEKGVNILSTMEKNFDKALNHNPYDYFDGNIDVDVAKTEFEKRGKKYIEKADELTSGMGSVSSLYQSAMGYMAGTYNTDEFVDKITYQIAYAQAKQKKIIVVEQKQKNTKAIEAKIIERVNESFGKDWDANSNTLDQWFWEVEIEDRPKTNPPKEFQRAIGMPEEKIDGKIGRETVIYVLKKYPKMKEAMRNVMLGKSIEKKRTFLSNIEVKSTKGYKYRFHTLDNYNPPTSVQRIDIDSETEAYLKSNLGEEQESTYNYENTDFKALNQWVASYCATNPNIQQIMKNEGIEDIKNLTPKEAIVLSMGITTERMEYSYLQASEDGISYGASNREDRSYPWRTKDIHVDKMNEEERKLWDEDKFNVVLANKRHDEASVNNILSNIQMGLCRNYSQVMMAVFDSLKQLQREDQSQLKNTYCKETNVAPMQDNEFATEYILGNHIWNTVQTVTKSGHTESVVIDATWADPNDPNIRVDPEGRDYTNVRFLYDLKHMVSSGQLTKSSFIKELHRIYDEKLKPGEKDFVYYAICEELYDNYKISYPEKAERYAKELRSHPYEDPDKAKKYQTAKPRMQ